MIVKLANALGRSTSSVSMKLCNFASLDPDIVNSGRKGLSNASKLDKQVWEEYHNDWDRSIWKSEELRKKYNIDLDDESDYSAENREITSKARIGQQIFRKMILANYGKCAICGIEHNTLLIASHILPWADHPHDRLNPRNGICLCALHDKAFDGKLLNINSDYTIGLSEGLYQFDHSNWFDSFFGRYIDKQILLPDKFYPDREFLRERGSEGMMEGKTKA